MKKLRPLGNISRDWKINTAADLGELNKEGTLYIDDNLVGCALWLSESTLNDVADLCTKKPIITINNLTSTICNYSAGDDYPFYFDIASSSNKGNGYDIFVTESAIFLGDHQNN